MKSESSDYVPETTESSQTIKNGLNAYAREANRKALLELSKQPLLSTKEMEQQAKELLKHSKDMQNKKN